MSQISGEHFPFPGFVSLIPLQVLSWNLCPYSVHMTDMALARVAITINHGKGTSWPVRTEVCPPECPLEGFGEAFVQAAILKYREKKILKEPFMISS